jgi:threonine aldolase
MSMRASVSNAASAATATAAIDLRSDTVTRPSPAMRRAMAEAEVGDDVYGEDPTVNRLQARVAELLGVEAALFVPSGSMANQIAIKVHTQPGDDVLTGRGAHNFLFESGAAGAVSGVQLTLLGEDGRFTAAEVEAAYKPDNHHYAPTRLVSVENTHNTGGGLVWDPAEVRAVVDTARRLGLATHLDGARLWNAAVASAQSERALAAGFDTVSVCLSKGLGAPVGSLLCGRADLVHKAHRVRKLLGGGMRQAGILAAAGLHALEHNRGRLGEDHANARTLARALSGLRGLRVDEARVHTNIIMVDLDPALGRAEEFAARAAAKRLLFHAMGPFRIRLVTHLDVDRSACERAAAIFAELCGRA